MTCVKYSSAYTPISTEAAAIATIGNGTQFETLVLKKNLVQTVMVT